MADRAAITAQLDEIYALSRSKADVEKMTQNQLRFFADQPTVVPQDQEPLVGRAAVARFYQEIFALDFAVLENSYSNLEIDIYGNIAIRRYTGTGSFQVGDPAETLSSSNNYIDVLVRQNGAWKTLVHSWAAAERE